MKISLKKLTAAMALGGIVALSGGMAQAASQGPVSKTSSAGTVNISVTVPNLIRIHGLTDVAFNFDPGVTESAEINFCVSGNNAAGNYDVVLTSGEGAFQLNNGGDKLLYRAEYSDAGTAVGTGDETYNTASGPYNLNGDLGSCTVTNASLNIYVDPADMDGALALTYTDTMTITVTPN